jgi:uncharacterized protein (DUF2141 family)
MKTVVLIMLSAVFLGRPNMDQSTVKLTVTVTDLRNNKGIVQFALYNKDGTIPDEDFKKYYKMEKVLIKGNSAIVVFSNLPKGIYAVNILHDENENGKIEKGFLLPEEGIGFSNFDKIGFGNKPNFEKASFELRSNKELKVKVVYF